MILGTKARYAVMAMVELAGRDEGVPIALSEIAASQEITLPYLEQIFAKLKNEGLVASVRGAHGGYVMSKPAADITVEAIIRAAEENMKMTRCSAEEGGCMATRAKCITHDLWEGLEAQIENYLGGISLADLRAKSA